MSTADVVIRGFQSGDGDGVARIAVENGAYYEELAPERFRQPTEAGLADFFEGDGEWRAGEGNLALVAEVDGHVAGVATRLVEAAEDWGRAKGAVAAVCDTYIRSPVSMPFWEARMGYTREAVIFRKPLV